MSYIQTFVLDGSEAYVSDVNSKLKFIANIKVGQKVDTDLRILQPDNRYTSLYRTFWAGLLRDEGREKTLRYIQETVNQAYCLADRYLSGSIGKEEEEKSYFIKIGIKILQNMRECQTGLLSLRQTYGADINFRGRIEGEIDGLQLKILTLEKLHNLFAKEESQNQSS